MFTCFKNPKQWSLPYTGGQFSDDDLNDLGDYKPDKGKGDDYNRIISFFLLV